MTIEGDVEEERQLERMNPDTASGAETSAGSDEQCGNPVWGIVRRVASNPIGLTGLVLVALLTFLGVFGPIIAPYDPITGGELRYSYLEPGAPNPDGGTTFWFGTDDLGRDVLSRTLVGANISLKIGVFVALLSGAIGLLVGGVAGYYGGWVDSLAMRVVDLLLAFPRLILAIAIIAVLQNPSLFKVFIVLAVTGWASMARLVRAQVLQAKELEFVVAAKSLGARDKRILLLHILPHVAGVGIIWITLAIPSTIMAEAGLSFLGLGAEPGVPSWGTMISDAQDSFQNYPWMAIFPGIALAISVLGYNLLGDALQDAINPRLRKG